MKIVINTCFGGFGLSHAAMLRYAELEGFTLYSFNYDHDSKTYVVVKEEEVKHTFHVTYSKEPLNENGELPDNAFMSHYDISRTNHSLVKLVEDMGEDAGGNYSKLEVVEIPDDVEWEIDDYDGMERIAEKHRTWG